MKCSDALIVIWLVSSFALSCCRPEDGHVYGRFHNGEGAGRLEVEPEAGVAGIGVRAINSAEQWAHFDLSR